MKNCIVAQSGGPTVAINASLAGVVEAARDSSVYDKVYGAVHGIVGVLREDFVELQQEVAPGISSTDALVVTPAMYLGSCRYRMPEASEDPEVYKKIFAIFEKYNVGAFFYIGGNDSMDTAAKLAAYAETIGSDVRIAGIPKTIDNDLILTDHTPGYGSAAKYVATALLEIAYDTYIYEAPCVTIVEIMGRDAGWLTAAAALARNESNPTPQLIYLPEATFDLERFLSDVKEQLFSTNNVVVAISEGIRDCEGNYISAGVDTLDNFGHMQLSGAGKNLETYLKEKLGIKVRSVELNIAQRCGGHVASLRDLQEAKELGAAAVAHTQTGATGFMSALVRKEETPYTCDIAFVDVQQVANKVKGVPKEWIVPAGNDVTKEMTDYIRPLILGETTLSYKDGLPVYLPILHRGKH